jgi:hypothetical protein
MSRLLELIRESSPAERAEALAVLVNDQLLANAGPVAVRDAAARTVGYLTPEVNAAAVLPFPSFTDDEIAELRRRAANPHESIPVEEFIRRFDAVIGEGK